MAPKELFDRYGPTLAVIGAIALLVLLLPGNGEDGTDLSAVGTGGQGASFDDRTGTSADTGEQQVASESAGAGAPAPGDAGAASAAGSASGGDAAKEEVPQPPPPAGSVFVNGGPGCRPDGRQSGISRYMPPCAISPDNNGGATARGVTADRIVMVRYIEQQNPATRAALVGAGASDTEEDEERIRRVLYHYMNTHYQTYGRYVEVVNVEGSGPVENDEAMRADAIKIAEDIGAFAVTDGPNSEAFTEEITERGVICLCTTSKSRDFYTGLKPYVFSSLPTGEEYVAALAEYIGKRLKGKPAVHSGQPDFQATDRRFGLVFDEGTRGTPDTFAKNIRGFYKAELAKYGVKLAAEASYLTDVAAAGDQANQIILKMKDAGVSNLLCYCDPLFPIFLTKEATRQRYFPEHLISGTQLTDTTFFGRTYDQAQWTHAFGISPLAVFWENLAASPGFREYHHAAPPGSQPGDEGVAINVFRAGIDLFFRGVQMAGPVLTADTFAQGMFAYPPTGGTPAASLVFFTPEAPTAVKDFTEVFWDATGQGKDETDKTGAGILLKAEGGKRYKLGQWPATDPLVLTPEAKEAAIYTSDNPPGGPSTVAHEEDGHRHDGEKCYSCR